MRQRSARVLAAIVLLLCSVSALSIDENTALSLCSRFLEKLELKGIGNASISKPDSGHWVVAYSNVSFIVDDPAGTVVNFTNDLQQKELDSMSSEAKSYDSRYSSDVELCDDARAILRKIYPPAVDWAVCHIEKDTGKIRSNFRVGTVSFSPSENGLNPHGSGNRINVCIDLADGSIVNIDIRQGWSYALPRIVLTKEQAIISAKGALQRNDEPVSVGLAYTKSVEHRDSEGNVPRELRVAYQVAWKGTMAAVDAESGEILNRVGSKAIARKPSAAGRPKPQSFLIAWIAGGLALVVAGYILGMRHSRKRTS